MINAADSLAAIKKNVFEDESISMKELTDVCKENFEGQEDLRQMLLRSPKFGNDDDYVDFLARDINQIMNHGSDHGKVTANLFESIGMHVLFGWSTGATPDGRKAWQPLADAGASPVQGMDETGPTAALNSATKIDPEGESWGILLNMKLAPDLMKDEAGLRNLLALIKTYLQTKAGHHIQFNVVSPETLKAAQKEPEKYKNLVVRVAGFSAYFTELGEVLQNEIIARTMHESF
jgi:formate C-acetyltransferase